MLYNGTIFPTIGPTCCEETSFHEIMTSAFGPVRRNFKPSVFEDAPIRQAIQARWMNPLMKVFCRTKARGAQLEIEASQARSSWTTG